MKLTLYNNFSEANKLNKNIVKIIELDGTLREASSLINPSIVIELDPATLKDYIIDDLKRTVSYNGVVITWNSFIYDYVLSCNYVKIVEFNRYYFINDIISIRNNLWRLDMHFDALMSYKENILSLDAFVTRNEVLYNPLVKDELVSYYYNKDVIEEVVAKGSLVNTTFNTNTNYTRNVVLSCISFNTIPAGSTINNPDGTNLPKIKQWNYTEQFSETCYLMDTVKLEYVSYRALKSDNLTSFIKSIVVFPFNLDAVSEDPTAMPIVYLGDTAIKDLTDNDVKAYYLEYKMSKYYVVADFVIPEATSFLDYEPYTQYELFIPYCNWIPLSANQVLGHRIIVFYTIQAEDGSANAYAYDVTDNKLLYTSTCQLGVRIGLSTTNNEEISASRKANNLNLTLGLVSSALSVGFGVASGNPVAMTGGVLSGAKSITSFVNNNSMLFDRAQATFGTGASGMYTSQDVILRKTKYKPKNYDSNYAKLFGKPLNEYKKIKDLEGYTEIADVHIEDIGSITENEFNELYSLLTKGFII